MPTMRIRRQLTPTVCQQQESPPHSCGYLCKMLGSATRRHPLLLICTHWSRRFDRAEEEGERPGDTQLCWLHRWQGVGRDDNFAACHPWWQWSACMNILIKWAASLSCPVLALGSWLLAPGCGLRPSHCQAVAFFASVTCVHSEKRS